MCRNTSKETQNVHLQSVLNTMQPFHVDCVGVVSREDSRLPCASVLHDTMPLRIRRLSETREGSAKFSVRRKQISKQH